MTHFCHSVVIELLPCAFAARDNRLYMDTRQKTRQMKHPQALSWIASVSSRFRKAGPFCATTMTHMFGSRAPLLSNSQNSVHHRSSEALARRRSRDPRTLPFWASRHRFLPVTEPQPHRTEKNNASQLTVCATQWERVVSNTSSFSALSNCEASSDGLSVDERSPSSGDVLERR